MFAQLCEFDVSTSHRARRRVPFSTPGVSRRRKPIKLWTHTFVRSWQCLGVTSSETSDQSARSCGGIFRGVGTDITPEKIPPAKIENINMRAGSRCKIWVPHGRKGSTFGEMRTERCWAIDTDVGFICVRRRWCFASVPSACVSKRKGLIGGSNCVDLLARNALVPIRVFPQHSTSLALVRKPARKWLYEVCSKNTRTVWITWFVSGEHAWCR